MNFSFRYTLISLLFILATPLLFAQQPEDDILLKAMQDELNRSMTELKLPEFDKPFFIMYGVRDVRMYSVIGNLGSLSQSSETTRRFKSNTRVLVGDYSFNDESLEDNQFSPPTAIEISLPLDNDYFGIRRSFWSSTDKVYRDAARHFEKHKETLKESGKTLAELPHRSFAKSEGVKLISSRAPYSFDKVVWENKIRTLSALYLQHPSIINSGVVLRFSEGYNYIVSSEGTTVKVPFSQVTFMSLGQSKNEKGEFAMDQIIHYASSPDQLPSEQQLAEEIKQLIERIGKHADLPKFEEEYTGPVLLMGPAVGGVISNILLRGRESLTANHTIPSLTGFQYNNELNSMESKIGKPLLHESLTVKMKPKLKSFNGTDLLGSFAIDDEGIVPPDELVVIERGILKDLMNDRTLSKPSHKANGFSSGPGVVEVISAQKDSEKLLKEKLIAQAKKEGLDYAIIIRDVSSFGVINVVKVSVVDGKEQVMQGGLMNQNNLKTLKRVLGASEKYRAYNLNATNREAAFATEAGLISIIVPEALLLEEMQIQPFRMPSLKEEEYVSNPLK